MNIVVICFILITIVVSFKGFNDDYFFDKYKFQVSKVLSGEKFRLFTSGFLHADFLHLGFNMYALYFFGDIVVQFIGIFGFCVIYIVSLLLGSLYSLQIHKSSGYYSSIGASGAVSGVLFSSIMLFPEMKLMFFPIPISLPAYVFGIGYLLYSIYGMKNNVGNIGHSAHLGGAFSGFVLTIFFSPYVLVNSVLLVCALGFILVGLLVYSFFVRK